MHIHKHSIVSSIISYINEISKLIMLPEEDRGTYYSSKLFLPLFSMNIYVKSFIFYRYQHFYVNDDDKDVYNSDDFVTP